MHHWVNAMFFAPIPYMIVPKQIVSNATPIVVIRSSSPDGGNLIIASNTMWKWIWGPYSIEGIWDVLYERWQTRQQHQRIYAKNRSWNCMNARHEIGNDDILEIKNEHNHHTIIIIIIDDNTYCQSNCTPPPEQSQPQQALIRSWPSPSHRIKFHRSITIRSGSLSGCPARFCACVRGNGEHRWRWNIFRRK